MSYKAYQIRPVKNKATAIRAAKRYNKLHSSDGTYAKPFQLPDGGWIILVGFKDINKEDYAF